MEFSNCQYAKNKNKKSGQKLIRPFLLFEKSNNGKITSSENTLKNKRECCGGSYTTKKISPAEII